MPDLRCHLSRSLWEALEARRGSTGESLSHIVQSLLASALELEHHTLFQVSTSGALVQGVYQGCVSVADLKRHGDFGLGTFDGLDGEMILLDGHCHQARGDGSVREAPDSALAPFAVVTRFRADRRDTLAAVASWPDLGQQLDARRTSNNVFYGLKLTGHFDWIRLRTACRSEPGVDLVTAIGHQAEFEFEAIDGTLLGFWTPTYARTLNVPGYHLHFISRDRRHGGHLLNLRSGPLQLELALESDFHMAIPETPAFLQADLSRDPSEALAQAEGDRP